MSAAVSTCRASFRSLGKHLAKDYIHLHVKIHADRRDDGGDHKRSTNADDK